jgi:hypothetical protein
VPLAPSPAANGRHRYPPSYHEPGPGAWTLADPPRPTACVTHRARSLAAGLGSGDHCAARQSTAATAGVARRISSRQARLTARTPCRWPASRSPQEPSLIAPPGPTRISCWDTARSSILPPPTGGGTHRSLPSRSWPRRRGRLRSSPIQPQAAVSVATHLQPRRQADREGAVPLARPPPARAQRAHLHSGTRPAARDAARSSVLPRPTARGHASRPSVSKPGLGASRTAQLARPPADNCGPCATHFEPRSQAPARTWCRCPIRPLLNRRRRPRGFHPEPRLGTLPACRSPAACSRRHAWRPLRTSDPSAVRPRPVSRETPARGASAAPRDARHRLGGDDTGPALHPLKSAQHLSDTLLRSAEGAVRVGQSEHGEIPPSPPGTGARARLHALRSRGPGPLELRRVRGLAVRPRIRRHAERL